MRRLVIGSILLLLFSSVISCKFENHEQKNVQTQKTETDQDVEDREYIEQQEKALAPEREEQRNQAILEQEMEDIAESRSRGWQEE